MFNWTTTRVINATPGTSGTLDEKVITYDSTDQIFRITRDYTFEKKYIKSIYAATPNDPELTQIKINLGDAIKSIGRTLLVGETTGASLNFYIQLDGSDESLYANDGYKKGKSFSIGFKVSRTASSTPESPSDYTSVADVVKEIKANVKKYFLNVYGHEMFTVDSYIDGANDTTPVTAVTGITIEGVHEFQRIVSVSITMDAAFDIKTIASWNYGESYTPTHAADALNSISSNRGTGFVNDHTYGKNAFGTYNYIIRNLRLPTAQNTSYFSLHKEDMPIPDAKYTQFIITYCAPSQAKPSLAIIGHEGMSTTTHVFWVKGLLSESNSPADKFRDVLETASGISLSTVYGVYRDYDGDGSYEADDDKEASHVIADEDTNS